MPTEQEVADLAFVDFTIDRSDERLLGPHGPIKLGNKAFRVLLMLAENEGRLITKDSLFSSVWDGTIVSESALTSVIKELRRALDDHRDSPRFIESVYGRGYRFIAPVRTAAPQRPKPVAPARPAVAEGRPPLLYIAAFDDLGARDSFPHLASVLREEILFALSRFRDIRLVSDRADTPPEGDYGDRDYRLSMKLAYDGKSIRAFARLCRLSTQAIIWADNIGLAESNLGPDVDRLVRRISAAALPRMHDDLLCNLPGQPHDLYDLYFLTRLRMRGLASLEEAQEVAATWEGMIEEHPEFAPAYPPLARLYDTDYCFFGLGSTGEAERQRAYELAHRALVIDPSESHLHTMKGWSHMWAGEWTLARQHLDEALNLNPYNESRLVEVATGLMYLEDLDGAAALLERCRELTPFVSRAPNEEQGLLHLLRGEFDSASEQLSLARRYHPDNPAGTRPSIMGELYSVLAAAGSGAEDLHERARSWQAAMHDAWRGTTPLTQGRIKQWVLDHNPFRTRERQAWMVDLLEKALAAAGDEDGGRRGTRSSPRLRASAS